MSEHAQNFSLYCTSLETFLERVHQPSTRFARFLQRLSRIGGQADPTVYLKCLAYQPRQTQGWPQAISPCYLGVLVTARVGDEVFSLWMIAGKMLLPSQEMRKQLVLARQRRLSELLAAALRAGGVNVVEHLHYHVPAEALQQIAPLYASWKAALEAMQPEAAVVAETPAAAAPKGGR